jgi:acetolactate decarboxylase
MPIETTESSSIESKCWCVEWFGSEGDFIAGHNRQPISLERFSGLESLYAIGTLDQPPGEISIFDSVALIPDVEHQHARMDSASAHRARFALYAIVETWRRTAIQKVVKSEEELEAELLPLAVIGGINVDEPFPFLLYGYVTRAICRTFCDTDDDARSPEQGEETKFCFSVENESIEVLGFYSTDSRGILTPRDAHFHMHLRTLDNRISGHLESFRWDHGFTVYLPANER